MSEVSSVEEILHQAERLEKEYEWLGAAELYNKALNLLSGDDVSRKGETQERLGYGLYRSAFQAENNYEFKQRLRQAIVSYEKAKEHYQKVNGPTNVGRAFRCDAMIAYMGYWLSSEVPEQKSALNRCWTLTKGSLKIFEDASETSQYGMTYNQLSSSIVFEFCLEWNFETRKKIIKEAAELGEQTVKFLSLNKNSSEIARAYARTAFYLGVFAYHFLDANEKETGYKKARECWMRAKEISEDVALSELTWPIFGPQGILWGEATSEALKNLREALEYSRKTKDNFNIGCVLDWLAYHTSWKRWTTDDPDEILRVNEEVLRCAEDAKQHYAPLSFISPRTDDCWVEAIDAEHLHTLSSCETDVKKKQALLEKAIAAAREGLKRAELSGYMEAVIHEHHVSSYLLRDIAELEKRTEEKKAILQEAMKHREESIRMWEQIQPFSYWNRSALQATLAQIKYKLAELARDTPEEKNKVQEAILDLENACKLGQTEVSLTASLLGTDALVYLSSAGWAYYTIGVWLNRLYEITNDKGCLGRAVKAFAEAVERYQRIDLRSRTAECQWKVAWTYGVMNEHLKAAENFLLASNSYKNAVERIPQLKSLYRDHASYMLAWAEIEKARDHHERQDYDLAKQHFEKAANLHRSLKQWNYLAPNYAAWAQLEQAEEFSRREQTEEAIKAFENAGNLFIETKGSIQTQLNKIENPDEKRLATRLVKATNVRVEYCIARTAVEEGRILDKKGDHYRSSEKYGEAVEIFEKIGQSESEQERREFTLIITLSKAWQKMTLAEAEASPSLYIEASKLFEEGKEFCPNEKIRMLLLGHSRFCKGLEVGTRFADSRNMDMYSDAVKYLESAANYYVKAGFLKASEYAEATKLLFDTYMHTDNAARENDPEKKLRRYAMAEKVLQTSAGYFLRAEHPEKREQVLGLLEKVKKEQELAASLMEVLHAPAIVSATTSFSTPAPTREQAVGSERFEHADVQANLIVPQKELKVGEFFDVEIELVNAGKGSALLIKVSEAIPEGFELNEKPETCRVEDGFVNMKGKRLDPLKTEEVKLVLKPRVQGTFALKPTILYLDENGKYRSCEVEPVIITVRELGIKGWLKGER